MVATKKKLMILGGSNFILPLIEYAHQIGIYVITCDYLPENIAHKFSDEYCNVSIIEKEEVLKLAKNLEIDGICSFACDPGVVSAAYVAEKLKLPSPGPYKSVKILQSKDLFRKFLIENNFNTPNAKSFSNVDDALEEISNWVFPLFVKPVDSAGSKGVTKVASNNEFSDAFNHAMNNSICKKVIVEEFIEKRGCSSDTDSFVVDGKLTFSSFDCQYFDKDSQNEFVPAAYSWPSSFTTDEEKFLEDEIQRALKLLKMNTGIYNIETRVSTSGKPYIMEMAPRGGGNRLAECLDFATSNCLIKNVVRAAVGLDLLPLNKCEYQKHWVEIILHSNKSGTFDSLAISDELRQYLFEEDLWVAPGDKISTFNGANNAIGTLIFNFDNKTNAEEYLDNLGKHIVIKVGK